MTAVDIIYIYGIHCVVYTIYYNIFTNLRPVCDEWWMPGAASGRKGWALPLKHQRENRRWKQMKSWMRVKSLVRGPSVSPDGVKRVAKNRSDFSSFFTVSSVFFAGSDTRHIWDSAGERGAGWPVASRRQRTRRNARWLIKPPHRDITGGDDGGLSGDEVSPRHSHHQEATGLQVCWLSLVECLKGRFIQITNVKLCGQREISSYLPRRDKPKLLPSAQRICPFISSVTVFVIVFSFFAVKFVTTVFMSESSRYNQRRAAKYYCYTTSCCCYQWQPRGIYHRVKGLYRI